MNAPCHPLVGMYLYGWYDKEKWRGNTSTLTPVAGYYCSRDETLATWQAEQIARTGIDYVIFEMVPIEDHSFETITTYVANMLPHLQRLGIGYVFFIDFGVFCGKPEPLRSYKRVIEFISNNGWLKNSWGAEFGQRIYLFSPFPDWLAEIRAITPENFSIQSSLWLPSWGCLDDHQYALEIKSLFERYWRPALGTKAPLHDVLAGYGYFPFWQPTEDLISMNGFASVIPGYDDRPLKRDPQLAPVVPRNEGYTLVEQFKRAVASGAHDILIYGWNEYFEATAIEPTLEYGDFYVRLTRELIGQAKRGKPIHMPAEFEKTEPAKPIYLTVDLERATQRHPDGIPRWDQDDYVAEIDVPHGPTLTDSHAQFAGVNVTNIGLKPWLICSGPIPIRLGIQLINERGIIVREGRAELGSKDLTSGEQVAADLAVEIRGLPGGLYKATIDIVWEGTQWFGCAKEQAVLLT